MNLRAFMVKVDQAEAEHTRAAEIASFMVVLLMLGSDGKDFLPDPKSALAR